MKISLKCSCGAEFLGEDTTGYSLLSRSDNWVESHNKCLNKPAPTRREWVGITDDDMLMIYGQKHIGKKYSLGRMVETLLRERNA